MDRSAEDLVPRLQAVLAGRGAAAGLDGTYGFIAGPVCCDPEDGCCGLGGTGCCTA